MNPNPALVLPDT